MSIWGIGYNQHLHGQHNTMSLINLMALTGNIGRPGAGPHSQTGQPNAMGERPDRRPDRAPSVQHRPSTTRSTGPGAPSTGASPKERLDEVAGMQNTGMAVGMMERALKGDVNAMFLIYATHIDLPDSYTLVRPALTRTFTVVQEIYKDAPNNLYADVILPAATWGEWVNGIYVQSERRLYVTEGTANPVKGCRPDLDMVIDKGKLIGERLGLDMSKIFPYERKENGFYDPEEIFRDFLKASKGTDCRPERDPRGREGNREVALTSRSRNSAASSGPRPPRRSRKRAGRSVVTWRRRNSGRANHTPSSAIPTGSCTCTCATRTTRSTRRSRTSWPRPGPIRTTT